ncbi:AraC family transcriptional regulator [Paenibacillus oceani]|uniref:Helix-turn-helix transcriptional regulator n=1 Tax=Paenibacillus oceani TaxID=2772510 RepID=A0A927H1E4_9BACL|nr:AraC family transcriptional regulator [Paenibacillus oceani]MBD2865081.1 helix-turn-helix transcriptional regulator [Paenibacillus oceani]
MFILSDSFYTDYLQFKVWWARDMYKPSTYTSDMRFPHTIFWLVYEGTWSMTVHGRELTAKPGDLLLFPPNTTIGLQQGENESIRYLSLCVDLKIGSLDLVTLYGLPPYTNWTGSPEVQPFTDVWRNVVRSFDSLGEFITARKREAPPAGDHTHMIHTDISLSFLGLQGALYGWLKQFLSIMRKHLPREPLRFDHRVMKVCDYVRLHLDKPLRLRDLAGHVHLSPSHLSHLFVKTLGVSPLEYVRQAKIQLVKELLVHSSCTIKEIAEKIGYGEQSQLSRYFSQVEGMSPLQFRNAATSAISL